MSRQQREHIVYAACDLIKDYLPVITEVFIESTNWRHDHPDAFTRASNDDVREAAKALGILEQKVRELKTG